MIVAHCNAVACNRCRLHNRLRECCLDGSISCRDDFHPAGKLGRVRIMFERDVEVRARVCDFASGPRETTTTRAESHVDAIDAGTTICTWIYRAVIHIRTYLVFECLRNRVKQIVAVSR